MKRSKGKMTGKTRSVGRKAKPLKVSDIIRDFSIGDKVVIKIKGNYHKGVPHPRYNGKAGIVKRKQGRSFVIQIKDKGKTKELISSAVHLERAG